MNQRAILLKQLALARRALSDEEESDREEFVDLAELVVELGDWLLQQELFQPDETQHPMQPIVFEGGSVPRFKQNHVVRFMLNYMTKHRMGIDMLVSLPGFSEQDFEQLYQLMGYTLVGYAEIFPHSEHLKEAEAAAETMQTVPPSSPPHSSSG